jgi:DNA-binding NtrC family response regulator
MLLKSTFRSGKIALVADASDSTLSINPARQETKRPKVPYLFLLLECERPAAGSSRHSLLEVDEVLIGRGAARELSRSEGRLELRIPDPRLSSRHARLVREGRQFVLEDLGSKNGSSVNGIRQTRFELGDRDLLVFGYSFFLFRDALPLASDSDVFSTSADGEDAGLVSLVPSLAEQLDAVKTIARSTVPVLVLGESGSGKELIARAVHRLSGRTGPLVALNCGAIAENLVESELFGYKKGAFSGANEDRIGLIRSAHGGTLFLDEVGDLPPSAQAALLRVLQEREVLPVGSSKAVPVDLRVVAATHRDLESSGFRADLLGRLRGFEVRLSPFRERREDFGLIVAALSARIANATGLQVQFSPDAIRTLLAFDWPLNIRQLEQCLTSSAALSGGRIEREHLPEPVRAGPALAVKWTVARPSTPARSLTDEEEQRRQELVGLFQKHGGNLSAVARELGKDRVQIRRWVKLYGIDVGRER